MGASRRTNAIAVPTICSVPPLRTVFQIRRISPSEKSSPTVKSSSTIPISDRVLTSSGVRTNRNPNGPATTPAAMSATICGMRTRASTTMKGASA